MGVLVILLLRGSDRITGISVAGARHAKLKWPSRPQQLQGETLGVAQLPCFFQDRSTVSHEEPL